MSDALPDHGRPAGDMLRQLHDHVAPAAALSGMRLRPEQAARFTGHE